MSGRYSDEPRCRSCNDPQVVHRGSRHTGVCSGAGCFCNAFAPSVFVSPPHSAPREGSSGSSAVDPGETSPVSASAPRYPQAASEAVPAPSLETAAPHAAPAARAHQPGGQP